MVISVWRIKRKIERKFIIILDCESSGLSPLNSDILSIGAVDYDSEESFYLECHATSSERVHDSALAVNGFTREQALDFSKSTPMGAYLGFLKWTEQFKDKTIAGINVNSFDLMYLKYYHDEIFEGEERKTKWPFGHRALEISSVAFVKFRKLMKSNDIYLALGMEKEPDPHNALVGARWEKEALQRLLA